MVAQDAAYNEMYFDEPVPSILQVPGAKEVSIEFHSLSKTFNMTGWRVGFAIGGAPMIAALGQVKANTDSGIFTAIQFAAKTALDEYAHAHPADPGPVQGTPRRLRRGPHETGLGRADPRGHLLCLDSLPQGLYLDRALQPPARGGQRRDHPRPWLRPDRRRLHPRRADRGNAAACSRPSIVSASCPFERSHRSMNSLALIGLGSNLGDRRATLVRAIEELDGSPGVSVGKLSSFHETEPVGGPEGQGPYLNAAAGLETTLEPRALLLLMQEIEDRNGRVRHVRWGERTLDLDLLLFGDRIVADSGAHDPPSEDGCPSFRAGAALGDCPRSCPSRDWPDRRRDARGPEPGAQ